MVQYIIVYLVGYKPTRPFYHPNPGNTLGQIIPPGKPWPANPEGYRDSSQAVDLSDRIKSATTQSGFIRKTETSSGIITVILNYSLDQCFSHVFRIGSK